MGKCIECGKEYEPKRSTSAYCSPKCKQAFYRNRIKEPVTVTPTKPVTVTATISGKCWCCGDDIQPGLVCCGLCAWSGRAKEKRAGKYPPLLTNRTPEQMERDLHSKELTGPIPVVIGKPGDADYDGICTPEWIVERTERIVE